MGDRSFFLQYLRYVSVNGVTAEEEMVAEEDEWLFGGDDERALTAV
jgi:hypothetical protein